MNITITTSNCTHENFYTVEEMADSSVTVKIEYPKIVSVQSRKVLITNVINKIQLELGQFKWLITGRVMVDFAWYLNATERQETDAIGDIDNISKPIQDAICGPNGLLVDDSQIGALYSYWITRNELLNNNILLITLKFNNDDAIMKKNLVFVHYSQAMCLPINVDFTNYREMIAANIIIKWRLKSRNLAGTMRKMGYSTDAHLVQSNYDFHRTRLSNFSDRTMSLNQFKDKCLTAGLRFRHYLGFFRSIPKIK